MRRRLAEVLLALAFRFVLGKLVGYRMVITLSFGTADLAYGDSGLESASSEGGGVRGYGMSHSIGESSTSSD